MGHPLRITPQFSGRALTYVTWRVRCNRLLGDWHDILAIMSAQILAQSAPWVAYRLTVFAVGVL
jgi:hypothetical protein